LRINKEVGMNGFKSFLGILCVGLLLLTASVGCNTIAGMGEDIESAGGAIEEEAED
jgi:predicted small secreted protein